MIKASYTARAGLSCITLRSNQVTTQFQRGDLRGRIMQLKSGNNSMVAQTSPD
jgi:hypothetical protein